MASNDKVEYLINKITELKSNTIQSSRKETSLEDAIEKLEENKQVMVSEIMNLKIQLQQRDDLIT